MENEQEKIETEESEKSDKPVKKMTLKEKLALAKKAEKEAKDAKKGKKKAVIVSSGSDSDEGFKKENHGGQIRERFAPFFGEEIAGALTSNNC